MPLGNGDTCLNAWIEPSGVVVFYIAKTDAWDDNGRLVKVGRVRIALDKAPGITKFSQRLRLRDATLEVVFGAGDKTTTLRLWGDANRPVIHSYRREQPPHLGDREGPPTSRLSGPKRLQRKWPLSIFH